MHFLQWLLLVFGLIFQNKLYCTQVAELNQFDYIQQKKKKQASKLQSLWNKHCLSDAEERFRIDSNSNSSLLTLKFFC